jgi:predicted lipoprotein with Yx(FWY)xxD motif
LNFNRRGLVVLAAAAVGLLVLAGCGSSSNDNSSSSTSANAPSSTSASTAGQSSAGATTSGAATVDAAQSSDLGQTILVGAGGRTLYDFEKDESGQSECNGACATAWPPLTTKGAPKASGGAEQSKLGTIKRDDGSTQVTYDGHPLYYFEGDTKPGQASGNGSDAFGAEWYALQPSGENAEEGGGSGDSS